MVLAAAAFAGHAAAFGADASDVRTARALVLTRPDVPSYWTATIIRNPCPSVRHPDVRVSGRAASRFGGLRLGVWSVAQGAPGVSQARALYAHVVATLPICVSRFWRDHYSPPTADRPEVHTSAGLVTNLGDERMHWRITVSPRENRRDPDRFDVLVVRKGRFVAQYVYSWDGGVSAVRQALQRV